MPLVLQVWQPVQLQLVFQLLKRFYLLAQVSKSCCSTNFYFLWWRENDDAKYGEISIIMLPILITAAVSRVVGSLIGIAGTKESAGFGFIGMIGPISAFKFLHVDSAVMSIIPIIIGFFVVPLVTAFILDVILRRVLKLFTNDIYKFMG